jgi:hypothetical protein
MRKSEFEAVKRVSSKRAINRVYARFMQSLRMVYARFMHGLRKQQKVYAMFMHVYAEFTHSYAGLRMFMQGLCLTHAYARFTQCLFLLTQGLCRVYAWFKQGLRKVYA